MEIRVGNSSSDLQRNPLCAWFPGTIGKIYINQTQILCFSSRDYELSLFSDEGITKTFTCARTVIGQHVFLQLVGVEGSLSLCEVEVFTTEGKILNILIVSYSTELYFFFKFKYIKTMYYFRIFK